MNGKNYINTRKGLLYIFANEWQKLHNVILLVRYRWFLHNALSNNPSAILENLDSLKLSLLHHLITYVMRGFPGPSVELRNSVCKHLLSIFFREIGWFFLRLWITLPKTLGPSALSTSFIPFLTISCKVFTIFVCFFEKAYLKHHFLFLYFVLSSSIWGCPLFSDFPGATKA